jgi:hypothetical protein
VGENAIDGKGGECIFKRDIRKETEQRDKRLMLLRTLHLDGFRITE